MFKSRARKQKVSRAAIVSVGKYMPPDILTNQDLERIVDTSDDWITARTGIKQRRIVRNGQRQSDLAEKASREALTRIGWSADDLDMIVVGTVTPDHIFPSSANTLGAKLGAIGVPSFDVLAACSGFMYAFYQGVTAIESGRAERVLVVGSEVMSSITDWTNRSTCVLFGDGAGAVLLEATDGPNGIIDMEMGSDGRYFNILHMKAGGSAHPPSHETVDKGWHVVEMEGQETFKLAVRQMYETAKDLLDRNRVKPTRLGLFIGHQANLRIIDAVTKRLKLRPNQVYNNIERYGNTTSATIPSCIYEAEAEGRIRKGDWMLLVSFGAGLTWGGALMKWAVNPLPKIKPIEDDELPYETYPDRLRPGREWQKT